MIRIILTGCSGKMGLAVTNAVESRTDLKIVAGVDLYTEAQRNYPIFASFDDIKDIDADVVIDFSNPNAFEGTLSYCIKNYIPIIECTTGLSDKQISKIKDAANKIPVFFSANMSLGVNLLVELAKTATKVLGTDYDIEIIEQHHSQKIDAPSGTALMIADAIKGEMSEVLHYEYDRHSKREKRSKNEIGIHAIRGGTIVGEHEVIFAGNDEIIKISHSARCKALFATGALNAALFICGKQPGLYDMSNLIK